MGRHLCGGWRLQGSLLLLLTDTVTRPSWHKTLANETPFFCDRERRTEFIKEIRVKEVMAEAPEVVFMICMWKLSSAITSHNNVKVGTSGFSWILFCTQFKVLYLVKSLEVFSFAQHFTFNSRRPLSGRWTLCDLSPHVAGFCFFCFFLFCFVFWTNEVNPLQNTCCSFHPSKISLILVLV